MTGTGAQTSKCVRRGECGSLHPPRHIRSHLGRLVGISYSPSTRAPPSRKEGTSVVPIHRRHHVARPRAPTRILHRSYPSCRRREVCVRNRCRSGSLALTSSRLGRSPTRPTLCDLVLPSHRIRDRGAAIALLLSGVTVVALFVGDATTSAWRWVRRVGSAAGCSASYSTPDIASCTHPKSGSPETRWNENAR